MVEREAFCCVSLADAMEAGVLDPAAVFSDLCSFDGRPWAGGVDLIVSGIPCQPYSRAGERRGNDDERALWPELVRVVAECGAGAVFIENTPDFLKHAEPVWRELRGLGFEWAPPWLSTASEYGAPHDRERVFLLAAHPDSRFVRDAAGGRAGAHGAGEAELGDAGAGVADPNGQGLEVRQGERGDPRAELEAAERGGGEAADPHRRGRPHERSGWLFNVERQTFRHDVHGCDSGCRICGSHWASESPPARVDDGSADWTDRTRATGMTVVPDQAAHALASLLAYFA